MRSVGRGKRVKRDWLAMPGEVEKVRCSDAAKVALEGQHVRRIRRDVAACPPQHALGHWVKSQGQALHPQGGADRVLGDHTKA